MMTKEQQARNPDYPTDYDEYLEDCYDVEIGNVTMSYEDWIGHQKQRPDH